MNRSKLNFNSMAAAISTAAGPAMGINAFLIWVFAQSGLGKSKFVLLGDTFYTSRVWVKEIGDFWEESYGGPRKKVRHDVILDVVYADSFDDLDWKRTHYYKADGESGWLSPEGVFWGCEYGGHCNLASYVIRTPYERLERNRWVHVDRAGEKHRYTYRIAVGEPTAAQEAWLSAHGHDLDPEGMKARNKEAEKLIIGDFVIDKAADKAAFDRMMAMAPRR